MDDEPSTPIGYRLGGVWSTTAFVGRGPVGEVHECQRSETEGVFIAKILPEELLESSETWASYLAAVSAAGSLPTEFTVRHVAFGSDLQLGCPFVVTERAPWPSLASRIKQSGPFAAKDWGKTLATLVALLERAHAAEIPHGRLTPTNVFVSPDDPSKVKVTDFGLGIACAARPGETLGGGVLGWAGPECEEANAKPSPAGDVYSLGLLTFFALTGKRPFRALDAEKVHQKLLRSEMTASLKSAAEIAKKLGVELEPAFDKWFSRAIVPSPDARYSTVRLLGDAFEHVLRRLEPEKPTAAASKPKSASLAASPSRPARTSAAAPDDQPTIKLKLETILAGTQPAQPAAPAAEAAAKKPAPVVPRVVSPRRFTALAPPIASPAPPRVAPAVPAPAIASPPVAVSAPPVAVSAPPAAVSAPPAAVSAPPAAVSAPPAAVSAPIVGTPVRAVGESTRVDPAPAQALAESTPSQFNPAALITPQSSGTGVPAVGTASTQPVEAGTAAPNSRPISRPKTAVAVAVGMGLVLFGLVVGIVIGERRGKSEAPAVREPARANPTEATTQAPSPAPPEASAPAPATKAHADIVVTPVPTATTKAHADIVVTPVPTATTKAHADIVVTPVPTATTKARKPDATKPDASKPAAAPARKKPCGTFINPCQ